MTNPIVNDTVELEAKFTLEGALTDPTTVVLTVTDPASSVTTYNWPTGVHLITHKGLGQFECDVTATSAGRWTFQWTTTGPVVTVINGSFTVLPLLETCTLQLVNGSSVPIPSAYVEVKSNDLTALSSATLDSTGTVVGIELLPGIYTVTFRKPRVAFTNPYAMVVVDTGGMTPQTFTFTATPLTIAVPSPQPTVLLFGYVVGGDGQPAERTRVMVETVGFGNVRPFVRPPSPDTGVDSAQITVRPGKRELITDATGYWQCEVTPDSLVRCSIPDVRFMKVFRVPNDSRIVSLNIRDARQDPGSAGGVGIDTDVGDRGVIGGES